MQQRSKFFVPGIIMIGIVLRTPFTILPIVLSDIADGLHVSLSSLGLLTSLPLIMFALCSSFAPRLARQFGTLYSGSSFFDSRLTDPNL